MGKIENKEQDDVCKSNHINNYLKCKWSKIFCLKGKDFWTQISAANEKLTLNIKTTHELNLKGCKKIHQD